MTKTRPPYLPAPRIERSPGDWARHDPRGFGLALAAMGKRYRREARRLPADEAQHARAAADELATMAAEWLAKPDALLHLPPCENRGAA